MRLVRFATTDGARYGILTGEHVTPTEARTLEDAKLEDGVSHKQWVPSADPVGAKGDALSGVRAVVGVVPSRWC